MRRFETVIAMAVLVLAFAAGPAAAVVNITTIYAIQQGSFALGDTVQVDNVVVIGVDVRPGTYGTYIQEQAGGAYSGILAYFNTVPPGNMYTPPSGTPVVGDLVRVKGVYAEFSGLSEIDSPTMTKLGTTAPLAPVVLPIDSLRTAYPGSERWEGVLVRVNTVQVTSIEAPFNNWRFRHYTGGGVFGDSLIGYEKMISGQVVPQVGDQLNVVGVLDWAFSARRIAPRNDADIIFTSPAPAAVPNLAYSTAENKIKVRFNVALNAADAQTPSKYSLSTFQAITAAVYDAPSKTVTLTVGTNLTPSVTPHVLSMSGIRNSQNVPMNDPQTIEFIGGISTIEFVQTPVSTSKPGTIAVANDSSRVANQQVSIRGVVTETTGGANPDFPAATGGFYMQQRGASQYAGIFVFGPPSFPVRGDSVFVSGAVSEFGVGPETEIVSVDEVTILGTNRPPMPAIPVTVAQIAGPINDAESEKFEGCLVKISGAVVLGDDIPPPYPGAVPGEPFDISTALAGIDTVRVDDLAVKEFGYTPIRGNVIDVTGIVRWSGSAPFRRLQPRNWSEPENGGDIDHSNGVTDSYVPAYRTELLQNRPNPFNPTTEIAFTMATAGPAALRVYAVDGRLVRTLLDGKATLGHNRVVWDGRDGRGRSVPTGIYLYRLQAGELEQTRKMMLVK